MLVILKPNILNTCDYDIPRNDTFIACYYDIIHNIINQYYDYILKYLKYG